MINKFTGRKTLDNRTREFEKKIKKLFPTNPIMANFNVDAFQRHLQELRELFLDINRHERDIYDLIGLGATYEVLKLSSTDTSNFASVVPIPWDTIELSNTDSINWDAGDATRITILEDGIYEVGGHITYTSSVANGDAAIRVDINGVAGNFSGTGDISASGWDYWILDLSDEPYLLQEGDFIEISIGYVTGASFGFGANANVSLAGLNTEIWVKKVQ